MIAATIERALWPAERLADALAQLAHAAGFSVRDGAVGPYPSSSDRATLGSWLDSAARSLRLDLDAIAAPIGAIDARLANAGPALSPFRAAMKRASSPCSDRAARRPQSCCRMAHTHAHHSPCSPPPCEAKPIRKSPRA
jgi:hypothetical protein